MYLDLNALQKRWNLSEKDFKKLGFTDERIELIMSDPFQYNMFISYGLANACYDEIKKNKIITIKKLSKILDKYCYYIEDFRDNELEQILESDNNSDCPIKEFYYDIDRLDGFIPGFRYKYITPNKIEILYTYIDS